MEQWRNEQNTFHFGHADFFKVQVNVLFAGSENPIHRGDGGMVHI